MHWIESIQHKYPDIFEECYQFSPPDGWRTLVESLIEYVNWHNTVHKTTIRLYQVVEAFGGLKFCIQHQPNQPIIAEEVFGAIHLAETLSCKLCIDCGISAQFRKEHVGDKLILMALCDTHYEIRKENWENEEECNSEG